MAANPIPPADSLEALAQQHLANWAPDARPLLPAERLLLQAAPRGKEAVCGTSSEYADQTNDPARAENQPLDGGWGPGREIRAGLIRWLCVDPQASKRVDPSGVWALGAKVTGTLDLSFATIPFPLSLYRCRVVEECNLQFVRIPAVYLNGSRTGAITADGANVSGCVNLNNGFTAVGGVRLAGASIGYLVCTGGRFENPGGQALNANGATIKVGAFLNSGFSALGEVNLIASHIGSDLDCSGGVFHNPGGIALYADKADIKGSVYLKDLVFLKDNVVHRNHFSANGEVNLLGAHIGSNLECTRGSFTNAKEKGKALNVASAQISGNVLLNGDAPADGGADPDSFHAQGEVNFVEAHIDGGLNCKYARFAALDLSNITVKQAFIWQGARTAAMLDLCGANVGLLSDDKDSWPANGHLKLDDFVYTRIAGPIAADSRLDWLARQPVFKPQPYVHFAKLLHDLADDDGSDQVSFELEKRFRRAMRNQLRTASPRWWKLPSLCLNFAEDCVSRVTVGYGVYPGRAIWSLLAMVLVGWILYSQAQRVGVMAPTDKEVYSDFHNNNKGGLLYSYPPFTPLTYSLENSVPGVKFGQDSAWQPDPTPQLHPPIPSTSANLSGSIIAVRDRLLDLLPEWVTSFVVLRWFRSFTIALGWLLATFFVAALSGVVRKAD